MIPPLLLSQGGLNQTKTKSLCDSYDSKLPVGMGLNFKSFYCLSFSREYTLMIVFDFLYLTDEVVSQPRVSSRIKHLINSKRDFAKNHLNLAQYTTIHCASRYLAHLGHFVPYNKRRGGLFWSCVIHVYTACARHVLTQL